MKEDFKTFKESLEDNPLQGIDLGGGLRKIRMTIASKGRGKSGGARVITYNIITKEDEGRVYLVEVYDKADFSTVDLAIVREMVDGLGL